MIKEIGNNVRPKELMIRELGVFELRGLARELGISSPTTKKREELIELIMSILEKGENIERSGKRKGRPYKKLSSLDDIMNSMIVNESSKTVEKINYESILTFAQEPVIFSNLNTNEIGEYEGYIRVSEDGTYTVFDQKKEKWLYIKSDLEFYDKLLLGDKVKVEGKLVSDKQVEVIKILTINNNKPEEYQISFIDKGKEIIGTNLLNYSGKTLYEGRRNAIEKDKDLYEDDNLKNFIQNYINQQYEVLCLGANIAFENSLYFDSILKAEKFLTTYTSDPLVNFNNTIDAINYTENLLNKGKKVILIISDIIDIIRSINACFTSDDEFCEQSMVVLRKLMSLGKMFNNDISCTLILFYNKLDKNNKTLINEILKISKIIE